MKLITQNGQKFIGAYEKLATACANAQNFLLTTGIQLSNDKQFKGLKKISIKFF